MNKSDIASVALGIILVVAVIGTVVWSIERAIDVERDQCEYDANVISVVGRYSSLGCQFLTSNGVWLDEQDYLMLCAVGECP